MSDSARYARIRALVEGAGSTIFSAQFTKKDGTQRVMTVQQAALAPRVKGDDASPSARQASDTRAACHPNLLNVYDIGSKGIRSINMDTLEWLQIRGEKIHLTGND